MQYKEITKRILAIGVGGLIIARSIFVSGVASYPLLILMKDIVNFRVGDGRAIFAGVILNLAHFSAGFLVISLGFEKLKNWRKPLVISTAVLAVTIAGFVAYFAFSY